jgi:hypothetical protein
MNFLHTIEDLWGKGPVRKLYYKQQFNLAFDDLISKGVKSEEAKGLAHLAVLQKLRELFDCSTEELYTRSGIELLMHIQPSGKGMFNGYKIVIDPADRYISGYIEGGKLELFEAANLTYDEHDFIVIDKRVDHYKKVIKIKGL